MEVRSPSSPPPVTRGSASGHGAVTARGALALLPAAVLLLLAGMVAAQPEESGDADAPWYAPWRAVDVQTRADAEVAWGLVRDFFGNLRQGHEHEVWISEPEAMAPARPLEECLAELEAEGLDWPRTDLGCRMSAQVGIPDEVDGLRISLHRSAPETAVSLGCELALRLPRLAAVLREAGIAEIVVGNPARFTLKSYHRFGLALDVYQLVTDGGERLVVEELWEKRPDEATCDGEVPAEPGASRLRRVACALFRSRVLNTVITPNYNDGHRNHFHWDVRPGDERFYLR